MTTGQRRRIGVFTGTLVAFSVIVAAVFPGAASAEGPTLTAAGSTWVQIALDQWRADGARQGININYQGVGSSAGRQFYIIGQVDFAASEIPFLPDEITQLNAQHKSFQYLPDVAGGTALMYNLTDGDGHQVDNLQLSAATIAKIFTGQVSQWNDPAIRAENPHINLPSTHLTPIIRSDGSGTSAKLADYLAHLASGDWNRFASANGLTPPVQFWPNFGGAVAVRGSDGVANFVSNNSVGRGAIGYVEAGYIYEHSLTPVYVRNQSGHYAAPTSENVSVALQHATLNADLTQNLGGVYSAPEAAAYPLASYSYLITQTTGFSPEKGAVLGKWIIYIACAGQRSAAPLGYSPLPPNLVEAVFQAVTRIPGAPTPPPLDAAHCPNPTITGEGFGGGPQQGPAVNNADGTATSNDSAGGGTADDASSQASDGDAAGGSEDAAALLPALSGMDVETLTAAQRAESLDAAVAASRRSRGSSGAWWPALLLLGVLALPIARSPRLRKGAKR